MGQNSSRINDNAKDKTLRILLKKWKKARHQKTSQKILIQQRRYLPEYMTERLMEDFLSISLQLQ